MARILKVIKSQFRDLSFNEFLGLLGKTVFLNDPYLVYKADVEQRSRLDIGEIEGIRIEKGTIAELENTRSTLKNCPWEFRCHVHDGVEDFFIAKDINGIQHISWIYSHTHHNRLLSLGDREVEIKHCMTTPALRGRGIYPKVIHAIMNYLGEQGTRRVFMCVHPDNHSSIRGIEKAGFTFVGLIRFRKFLGIHMSKRLITSEIKEPFPLFAPPA